MPEQKRTTETQDEKLRRQEIKQEAAAREAARQATFAASGGGPVGPPDDISIQAVAARLGDRRFQTAQRQAMAARIRQVSGNRYLQRVLPQKDHVAYHTRTRRVADANSAAIQRQPPTPAEPDNTPTPQRNKNLLDATLTLNAFEQKCSTALSKWRTAAHAVGTGYEDAVKWHGDAVAKRKEAIALERALMLAVFNVALGGSLSWMGTAMKSLSPGKDVLIDGLGEVVKAGVGKYCEVKAAEQGKASQPTSKGTLGYQNNIMAKVEVEQRKVNDMFAGVYTAIRDAPASNWDQYNRGNLQSALNRWYKQSLLPKAPNWNYAAQWPKISKALEKGLWAKWAPRLQYSRLVVGPWGGARPEKMYHKPKSAVEDRLYALGVFPKDYFGWYTFDSEIKEIIAWAGGYTQEKLLDL